MASFWEYEPEDQYIARKSKTPATRLLTSKSRQAPDWAQQFQTAEGDVTVGSAAKGGINSLLALMNAPAEYIGKPLLGAGVAALTPGEQIRTDPSKGFLHNVGSVYGQWRQLEEERPSLGSVKLGPITIDEKWITENLLADPLFWLGIGGAAKTAQGLKLLKGAGFGDDILKLAAKGQIDDVVKMVGKSGLGDDALRALKQGDLLNKLDMATSPLAWPGAVGSSLVGAAKGEALTPAMRFAGRLLGDSPVAKGAAEILGRGTELGGWAASLQPRLSAFPISTAVGVGMGQSLPQAIGSSLGLGQLAEGIGMDRWLAPLQRVGTELLEGETGALRLPQKSEQPTPGAEQPGRGQEQIAPGPGRPSATRGAGRPQPTLAAQRRVLPYKQVKSISPAPNVRVAPGSDCARARGSWTQDPPTILDKIFSLGKKFISDFYDRFWHLRKLQRETGIKTHWLAKVVGGAEAGAEADIFRYVEPLFEEARASNDEDNLITYAIIKRMQGGKNARGAAYKLPGGVEDPFKAEQEMIADIGEDHYRKIVDLWDRLKTVYDELVMKPRIEEGLLSQEAYERMKTMWPDYISFARQGFDLESFTTKLRSEASVDEAIFHGAKEDGSVRKLDRPKERFYAEIVRTATQVARNKAARSLAQALDQFGRQTGEELLSKETRYAGPLKGTIHYYENGHQVEVHVPTQYEEIAKGLDAMTVGPLIAIFRPAANVLRMGATAANPSFAAGNAIRDGLSAWMKEGVVPLSPMWFEALAHTMGRDETWHKVAKSGALNAGLSAVARKPEGIPREIAKLGAVQVKSIGDALLVVPRLIMRANEVIEQTTRVATWKKLEAAGVPELERAVRSRDVSVDFRQAGNVIRMLNQIIPFLNAGVQGVGNTVSMFSKENVGGTLARLVLPLMGVAAFHVHREQQFPETKDLIPNYEFRDNWIVQIGEGEEKPDPEHPDQEPKKFPIYIKIPKGPVLGPLLAVPEALAQIAADAGDKTLSDQFAWALKSIVESVSPIDPKITSFIPPGVDTFVQLAENRDWFRQKDIVPESELSRPPEAQFGQETSTAAVLLGKAIGVSPRKLDFVVGDTMAGAGKAGLWVVSLGLKAAADRLMPRVAESMGIEETLAVPGAAKLQEKTPIEKAAEAPIASRFIGVRRTAFERSGHDRLEKAVQAAQTAFYQNPEVKRFGIGFQPPADTMTVDGQTVSLTPQQRAEIVERSTPLVKIAFDRLIQRPRYRAADDINKRKMLSAVRAKILDNVRSSIMSGTPLWGEQEARLLPLAYEQYLEYQELPRYQGLNEEQAQKVSAAQAAITRMRRANPGIPSEVTRAVYAQMDPEGARLVQIAGQLESPLRRLYWAQHPLLSIFFGGISPEQMLSVMPQYGAAVRTQLPSWATG